MRINKFLSSCGLGSRRSVERFVLEGRVTVNNAVVKNLSQSIDHADIVRFDGSVVSPSAHKYCMVNKPVGYVCTNNDINAPKKIIDLDQSLVGLSIVGRLDCESEGLVLLSNDGDFVYKHQHPSNLCEKEYVVEVKLPANTTSLELEKIIRYFSCGTVLAGYRTKPAKIKIIAKEGRKAKFNIVLTEGRKRQIREIFAKEKIKVVVLKRVRIGQYKLGNLELGEVRQFFPLDS